MPRSFAISAREGSLTASAFSFTLFLSSTSSNGYNRSSSSLSYSSGSGRTAESAGTVPLEFLSRTSSSSSEKRRS
ncbi:hypothetical protein PF010_g9458 [Phytophthora fragariae]|uniref:Uncharacterized protein n=1 Tax=Phytophthora fragariae TaxID=53985 RepID=A0A6A3LRZ3_9STRA|nr:hypothetical protein PF011_g6200 [Phytophthora fragariae]KAE9115092.1 hypothetical protein PF010_g9458 [Phytophthora fragariae]KAE9243063.1 hypothetical protein PF004_g6329 [Phytophthora fragariae]KAE9324603.1 hypothetical protein PF008_g17073 [Phytophthora fragariae]